MDAQKLLRILKDLQKDEEILAIGQKLDEIRGNIAQNNQEGFDAAKANLDILTGNLRDKSIAWSFTQTEMLLLNQIGGGKYFGAGLLVELEHIFAGRGFELVGKLDKFKEERQAFLKKVQKLVSSFTDISIEEYRPSEYEIGIVIPEGLASTEKLEKYLKDFKILFSTLIEATGGDHEKNKITRVGNGSLEFFSLQTPEVALLFSSLLLNITGIWEKIAQFRKKINETKSDGLLSPAAKKQISEILNAEAEKLKEEILEELPETLVKQSKISNAGDKNQFKNKVRISLRAIFGWFEAGIEVDITPVRVVNPQESPEESNEKQMISNIQKTVLELRKIYQLPAEEKVLPFKLTGGEEDYKAESAAAKPETETKKKPAK